MNVRLRIAHPDWLRYSKPETSIRLFCQKKMPEVIAGWCIVVGCKHPLRAVYGSDLKAAWALLKDALKNKLRDVVAETRCQVWCWWHTQPRTAYWDLQQIKLDKKWPDCAVTDDEVRH